MKIDRLVRVLTAVLTPAVCAACYVVHDPPPPGAQPAAGAPAPVAEDGYHPRRALAEQQRQALLRGTWRRRPAAPVGAGVGAGTTGTTPTSTSAAFASPVGSGAPMPAASGAVSPAPAPSGAPVLPPLPAPAGCLDGSPTTVPACALQPVDASCKATSSAAQRCQVFASALFDPKVGAAAVACMNKLSGKDLCDPTKVSACGHLALASSCPDAETVAPLCQIAEGPCKVTEKECLPMLSGLGDKGQDLVAQCIAQGCSSGLAACVDSLK